jgi:SAM-dependent methyltransferase
VVSFDRVAEEYAAGRPSYPDAVFDALQPLAGRRVLEGGAGTGIATRALLDRGAAVVPFDIGPTVLRKSREHMPDLCAVVADGARLPFRADSADLVCFAQSWHWLDPGSRVEEAARVLRDGGRWAAWWSHARADGDAWFDRYWDVIEELCPGVMRSRRDEDEGVDLTASGLFDMDDRRVIRWVRHLDIETWLLDDRSRSFVMAMTEGRRTTLLDEIRSVLERQFPHGQVDVAYETWLWIGVKR